MENQSNPEKPKKEWRPQTKEGKRALIFGIITIVWGLLFIPLVSLFRRFVHVPVAGSSGLWLEIVLFIFGLYYSVRTIFKIKERTTLNIVIFILLCLVGGFWLLFALGEIISPH